MSIKIDYARCTGCKVCYEVCPTDVFGYHDKTHLVTVDYPEDCWYCGACVLDCPVERTITLSLPLACL